MQIYYNTALRMGIGSRAREEEALEAIGVPLNDGAVGVLREEPSERPLGAFAFKGRSWRRTPRPVVSD